MRRVVLRAKAVADIAEIVTYIAGDKPGAALKIEARLYAAAESLAHFPERGPVLTGSVRQLSDVAPYLIRYRMLRDGSIVILSVVHGARR